MDALSRIFTWLSHHEAGIRAVVGSIVISSLSLVAARVRALFRQSAGTKTSERAHANRSLQRRVDLSEEFRAQGGVPHALADVPSLASDTNAER